MISFDRLVDSLKKFDNVVIVLKGLNGDTLDVVYRGKVESAADVHKLKAPHWDGGKVIVSIMGEQGGKVVYKVETRLDPATNTHDGIVVYVSPEASLLCTVQTLTLLIGDSLPLPTVTVLPENLADKTLDWKWEPAGLMTAGTGFLKAAQAGTGTLTVALKNNPAVKLSISVTIASSGSVPESILIKPDTLEVVAGGLIGFLTAKVSPSGAASAIDWTSTDTSIATVDSAGQVSGKRPGETSVSATSKVRPSILGSAHIKVKSSLPPLNDIVPPGKPIVRVNPVGPTKELRPTWSWASASGGAGSYQIVLDKNIFDSSAMALSDTLFKPAVNLVAGVHYLYVRERDAAGNWSLPGSAQVEIDTTGPAAPKIIGTSPTSTVPRWTWSTGGGGGAGVFRSRLGDANFPAGSPESTDTLYLLAGAVSGTAYTLYVQERDAAGNWSPAASLPIKYDLTKPTVTISLPQASGTFIISTDTVSVKGSCSGPNGIAKVEYTVDGGVAVPVTLGTNGSWSLVSLTVANARTTVIKIVVTDNLGNTGDASISILRDSDLPSPPVSLSSPASPTNLATASWTWSSGSDGATGSGLNGKYQWKLNSGAWTNVSGTAATAVTLAEGSNTFSVQEQDLAGNWSIAANSNVVLDTKAPDAVTFTGIDGGYTASATPTWTWSPSTTNGGIAKYTLKLDAGAEFEWTTTTFTPTTALTDDATHTLTVKQQDQVAGVTGAPKSFSYKVKVNPPSAPTVKSAANVANNGLTNNPKFTWTSGGGGNGKYRVRMNAETTYRTHPQTGGTQTDWSLASTDADGTYTIHVSEQDDLGRWGPEGDFAIQLDRTGPVYTEVVFKGTTLAVRDGYVTNVDSLTISYKADNVAKEFGCKLDATGAAKACMVVNSDALGNASTLQRTVYCRKNVVFFKPVASGAKDGSSWENARNDLTAYLNLPDAEGKDLWLASGDYSSQDLTINFKWVNIYGGFNAASFPVDINFRTKTNTILGAVSFYGGTNKTTGVFDGLEFSKGFSIAGLPISLNRVLKKSARASAGCACRGRRRTQSRYFPNIASSSSLAAARSLALWPHGDFFNTLLMIVNH